MRHCTPTGQGGLLRGWCVNGDLKEVRGELQGKAPAGRESGEPLGTKAAWLSVHGRRLHDKLRVGSRTETWAHWVLKAKESRRGLGLVR